MKRQFNREFLEKYCLENEIKYDPISEDIKITRETKIKGKCINENCVNNFEKTFRMMVECSNGYCTKCTTEISSVNSNANKYKSNYTELMVYIRENNITLCREYENTNITKEKTCIRGLCINKPCNNIFDKTFRMLVRTGGYCDECTLLISQQKIKDTCMERFGTECPLQNEEVKQKIKDTCMERYDVEHCMLLDETKQKIKNTCIERFGVKSPLQNESIKQKSRDTCMERFGVESPLQNESIKQKVRNTCIERYGVENPSQSEEVKQKKIDTCMEHFNVPCSFQSEEVKQKSRDTCMERFGVEYCMQSEEVKQKGKDTCLEKYGVGHPMLLDEIKRKIKNTNIERFGVENPLQNESIKQKSRDTCMERFGVECPLQNEEVKQKIRNTCIERYGVEHPMQVPEIADKCSKSAFTKKNYTLPSGKILQIQGYEHFALDECVTIYQEDDIINGMPNVPEIWYNDEDGKKHRHYVDLFIPSKLLCIEVKSTWTAEKKKDNIFLKQKSGKALGYQYEIWVYDGKGNKVECYV